MKAAVFLGVGRPLEIQDLAIPDPGPDEVVLRVERCGICATDLHLTSGHDITVEPGSIIGHEVGAEVVSVGRDVVGLKPGDAVIPMPGRGCGLCAECLNGRPLFCREMRPNSGGYAQYMLSSAHACVPIFGRLSLADAALVEPLTVGLLGVTAAPIRPGDRVLILGAGPIGLAVSFWAERMGARQVVLAAPSNRRESIVREMGASDFIVMHEGYEGEIVECMNGPPDVVVECVGAPGLIGKSIELVKALGTVVVLGLCTHIEPINPVAALFKQVRIQFALGTTVRMFEASIKALDEGAMSPRAMVTDTISLAALPKEFEDLRRRTHQCKVLVAPWQN